MLMELVFIVEFDLNEPSIRKRTRSQVEYFKDQQTKNQRPNNSLPLTTFTQSMAQAATSALHDNFIRKNGSAATSAAFSDGKHDTDMFTQVDSVVCRVHLGFCTLLIYNNDDDNNFFIFNNEWQ